MSQDDIVFLLEHTLHERLIIREYLASGHDTNRRICHVVHVEAEGAVNHKAIIAGQYSSMIFTSRPCFDEDRAASESCKA